MDTQTGKEGTGDDMAPKTTTRKKTAFDAARGSFYSFDPADLVIIGHDTKHTAAGATDDGTVHYLWDKRIKDALDPGFVDNIAANGVDTAILVAKIDDEPVVVAGRKRTMALRAANKGKAKPVMIKALIVHGTPMELRAMMTRENAARAEMTMIEKANEAKLQVDLGRHLGDIAVDFACSTKQIENWLALANATKPVREAVISGLVPATAATKIARLADPEAQKEALDEALSAGKVTTRSARAAVAKTKSKKNGSAKDKDRDDDANGIGLVSRRDQKKLLVWLGTGAQAEKSVYWDGVADTLKVILGEKGADKRIKAAVKKALRA